MELVHEFKTALKNLYRSKPPIPRSRIQLVASVAIKANRMYKHVVMYMEKYAEKIPGKYKLTALCVIDSIIRQSIKDFGKNKDVYAPRFKKKLKLIFHFLKKCKQKDKSRMVRILTLWQKHKIYKSELVEPLLSIISPELKSHKRAKAPDKSTGAVQSVAANALAIIHQQQTQIQALQQLQALKNLNSLAPSFVNALQALHMYQQQIAEGKSVEIPPELIDQLRLFQSLVQQSADPQPLDYRGLLRTDYHEVQESAEYSALPSTFDLPGISNAPPGSPRDRRLAPYHSINSNKAHPVGGGPTPLLDDFDYGDDEDDAERIAAQKRRVEQEKKRVELAAKESARAREKSKRKKRKEIKKKKSVPGNATPTQDEVDSPRRYKNQDIDNELERLLMSSAVKLGAFTSFNQVPPTQLANIHESPQIPLSPISVITSPSRIPALFNHVPVSPISAGAKTPSSGDNDDIVMEEYFNRSPSNVSDDFADDSQRLIICTEEQKESAQNGENILEDSELFSGAEDKEEMTNEEKEISESVDKDMTEMVAEVIAPEDDVSLPDSNLTMDDIDVSGAMNSPLFSDSQESLKEDDSINENKNNEANQPDISNNNSEQNSPSLLHSPAREVCPLNSVDVPPISQEKEHSISPNRASPESSPSHTTDPYDPLFPTRDVEDMFLQITPVRQASLSPQSPYASSLEEVFPDLALSNMSPITGSHRSSHSLSPIFARNPSPPCSPRSSPVLIESTQNFPKSIFDVTLPFDNITPPRGSDLSSSSCISDISPVIRENSLECVTPPNHTKTGKTSPLSVLIESVREKVKEMESIETNVLVDKKIRSVVTPSKASLKDMNGIRSVIIVKTNKSNSDKSNNSKRKKRKQIVSSSSSSSSTSTSSSSSSSSNSSSDDSVTLHLRRQIYKHKMQLRNNKNKHSSRPNKTKGRHKTTTKHRNHSKRERREHESPEYRQIRRVRSESIESVEMFCPPNTKDCLVIYTNIIKVESKQRALEKYHLRKYISAYVGDIELFDIMNDHTAALIQLSNRKSADRLKEKLEYSNFQCTWVPGFKVMPGIYWDDVNGVTYVPWMQVTDDPPYNLYSLQKGGTIEFSEIKKELDLIDRQRALEKEALDASNALEEESLRISQQDEKIKHNPIRLCCQDSENTDSSTD